MTTTISMRAAPAEELEAYVRSGDGMDKAGSYGIQGEASAFVAGVEGCYLTVVGFPLCVVAALLSELGVFRIADPVALCSEAALSLARRSTGERRVLPPAHPAIAVSG
jgi:hypothetical protein